VDSDFSDTQEREQTGRELFATPQETFSSLEIDPFLRPGPHFMLSYQGDDQSAKLATAWPSQNIKGNWGIRAEGAAQTAFTQGIQSGFVRGFYTSAVESLEPDDAISRTIIKFFSRKFDSPISSAYILAERGSDLGVRPRNFAG
jgi:hypothetical protein